MAKDDAAGGWVVSPQGRRGQHTAGGKGLHLPRRLSEMRRPTFCPSSSSMLQIGQAISVNLVPALCSEPSCPTATQQSSLTLPCLLKPVRTGHFARLHFTVQLAPRQRLS